MYAMKYENWKNAPKLYAKNRVNIASWLIIGAANTAAPALFEMLTLF